MNKAEQKKQEDLIALFEQRKFVELIPLCEKFVKTFKGNAVAWNLLALSHKNLGNLDKAISLYVGLLRQNPNNSVLLSNLGNIYKSVGRLQDALGCYKKAVDKDPKLTNAVEALGICYMDLGDFENALSSFEQATELEPDNQSARYNLANMYRKMDRYEEAVEQFELTDYHNAKSHQLEGIYLLGKEELFKEKCHRLESMGKLDPLIGCVISHAEIRYDTPLKNPFCSNSLDYIVRTKVSAEDGLTQDLIDKIIAHHKGNLNDYKSQALLKNGKQSSGNLFLLEHDFIRTLEKILINKVEDYRQQFLTHEQGFIKKWPNKYFLYGWLVSITSGGNLNAHIHKEGWLSGSLYFNVPTKADSQDGSIGFSLHGANYPNNDKNYPGKVVEVEKRDLCIFPSSVFHYTIPFESDQERISFAFDVMPVG